MKASREADSSSDGEVDNDEPIDNEICVETKRIISMQTELTIMDITTLQSDNQNRQEE